MIRYCYIKNNDILNIMDSLESDSHQPSHHVIIYKDDKAIGYTNSYKEADALCDKYPNLQWDFKKTKRIDLPLLTIHDSV
jgi:hypothetical protein